MERSSFESLHPGAVATRARTPDFDILRVPLWLDLADLQKRLARTRALFPWQTKDSQPGYEALGLQFSDSAYAFTDAVDATSNYEARPDGGYPDPKLLRPFRMYERINEAGQVFENIFRRLYPVRLFRSRLLTAHGGFQMTEAHVDGPFSVRLHLPIETNPDAWIEIENRRYHLPADGSAYLVNTSRAHRIGNDGTSARTHLVSVIYPNYAGFLHPLAQAALIRMIEGPLQGLKKELDRHVLAAKNEAQNHCQICGLERTLYGVPVSSTQLKALCGPCIETVGRAVEIKHGLEGSAVDEFEIEAYRSTHRN